MQAKLSKACYIKVEQDLYNQPVSKLVEFIVASYAENPDIILEVFVHKAEKLQEDDKIGVSATSFCSLALSDPGG